jgi:hypothetical protein
MKIFLSVAIAITPFVCTAQDITTSTTSWHSERTMNVQTGEFSEEATTLITYGKTRLEWKNQDGSLRHAFTVREVNGSWTNIAQSGAIIYEVSHEQGFGTVFIEKSSAGALVRIMLTSAGEPQFFEVTISNYEVQ